VASPPVRGHQAQRRVEEERRKGDLKWENSIGQTVLAVLWARIRQGRRLGRRGILNEYGTWSPRILQNMKSSNLEGLLVSPRV
jgi:hypothetical protein